MFNISPDSHEARDNGRLHAFVRQPTPFSVSPLWQSGDLIFGNKPMKCGSLLFLLRTCSRHVVSRKTDNRLYSGRHFLESP
jgi:hypothetical protein